MHDKDKYMAKNLDNIDQQMDVIRFFIDEFYNKTVFKSENKSGTDLSPSFIKSIFAFVNPEEEYPIGELGKNARVKSSTMTDMVDRMEDEGMAERVRDKNDRRLVKVRLTDKGKKTRQEFYVKRRSEFESLFKQLAPEEVRKFVKNLSEATEILRKIN